MKIEDVKEGDKLVADGGFTCLSKGDVREVVRAGGDLAVQCALGLHFLDGQRAADGTLIGFAPVAQEVEAEA